MSGPCYRYHYGPVSSISLMRWSVTILLLLFQQSLCHLFARRPHGLFRGPRHHDAIMTVCDNINLEIWNMAVTIKYNVEFNILVVKLKDSALRAPCSSRAATPHQKRASHDRPCTDHVFAMSQLCPFCAHAINIPSSRFCFLIVPWAGDFTIFHAN